MSMANVTPIRSSDRPESLRSLISRGADLQAHFEEWGWGGTGEDVWSHLIDKAACAAPHPGLDRLAKAAGDRAMVDLAATGRMEIPGLAGSRDGTRRTMIGFQWEAELLEDPGLSVDLLALAPERWVAEFDQTMEGMHRGHELTVLRVVDGTWCSACGQRLEVGTSAVSAEDTGDAMWCVACIEAVAARARIG